MSKISEPRVSACDANWIEYYPSYLHVTGNKCSNNNNYIVNPMSETGLSRVDYGDNGHGVTVARTM